MSDYRIPFFRAGKTESELLHFSKMLRTLPEGELARSPYWWCHVDDDNYVLVPALRSFLGKSQSCIVRAMLTTIITCSCRPCACS